MNKFPCGQTQSLSRRELFCGLGTSLGALALQSLLQAEARAADATPQPHFTPKAKSVILLFMEGGPSHMDTFDPKPKLHEIAGQEFIKEGKFVSNMGSGKRYYVASPFEFAQHGESGMWMCDKLPYLSSVADELCLYRGLQVESVNHPEAVLQFHTGNRFGGEPGMGAWSCYGLGTENENLPAYVVLPESVPQGGSQNWSNGFLPARFQGTPLRAQGSPILDLKPRAGVTPEHQRRSIDLIEKFDTDYLHDHPAQDRLRARLENYELAFRMQTSVPDLVNLDNEPEHMRKLYGIGNGAADSFGRKCLLARRLVEKGVRFVHLVHNGWDAHEDVGPRHTRSLAEVDQPIAGLLHDLRQRGLLDDTLVVWAGEFGRTPDNGIRAGKINQGRDHNPDAMSVWLAGGGSKAGHIIGATDDIGAKAVDCMHHLRDFHCTLLRLLGLDDNKLTYFHQGRFTQLSQIGGKVIEDLIA